MSDHIVQGVAAARLMILPAQYRWRFFLPLVLVMAVFVLILTAGNSAALLLPPQADIFAPYQSLFPGEAEAEMDQYPCTLFEATYDARYGVRKVMCVLTPENGVFRRVIVFTTDGKITGINFHMRNVRLADLIWQWGRPDRLYRVSGNYKVVWKGQLDITAAIDRRFSPQAPVNLVAINQSVPTASSIIDNSDLCGNPSPVWACGFAFSLDRH